MDVDKLIAELQEMIQDASHGRVTWSEERSRIFTKGIEAIREMREELRIAKNSRNWEEGQRCFAERDAALAECRELTAALDAAVRDNAELRHVL